MAAGRRIRSALIDLSGTLHVDDEVIAGAVEAIDKLRQSGINVKFASNTTKESRRLLFQRLQTFGFHVHEKDIFTSLTAARNLIVEHRLTPYLLVHDHALEDFHPYFPTNTIPEAADAVVVGLAPEKFGFAFMNEALEILLRGCPLIAIHKSRYFKTKSGLSLGPGPLVTALEFASDCKATVVGKPNRQFFLQAIRELGSSPDECVMIGDDVRDDVLGAQAAGFTGMLVKTGKYRAGDEDGVLVTTGSEQVQRPDFVFESIVQAVDAILSLAA